MGRGGEKTLRNMLVSGTVDPIFSLYAIVQKYLLKYTKLYVAFVDFQKTFDSVNRNRTMVRVMKRWCQWKTVRGSKGFI